MVLEIVSIIFIKNWRYKNRVAKSTPSPSLLTLFLKMFSSVADQGSEFFYPGSRDDKAPDPLCGSARKNLSI
jgi:hypothetical protein